MAPARLLGTFERSLVSSGRIYAEAGQVFAGALVYPRDRMGAYTTADLVLWKRSQQGEFGAPSKVRSELPYVSDPLSVRYPGGFGIGGQVDPNSVLVALPRFEEDSPNAHIEINAISVVP